MNRKNFIQSSFLATAGLGMQMGGMADIPMVVKQPVRTGAAEAMKICIFSKQLQWMNYADMAKAIADLGYDGIDLTVRAGGHVLPENVERDLPKAMDAAEKAGIRIMMISTDIKEAGEPYTERILKTAAGLDIHYYRSAGLNYRKDVDIPANITMIKKQFSGLADMNKRYGMRSDYLNHSGEGFGACLWDLWLAVKDLNPAYIGSQFDIKHASIAGAYSWPVNLKLLHAYVQTMVIRDFRWERKSTGWEVKPVPIGEGMVDMKKYFNMVKQYGITGPISVMCDYELGGAENGAAKLTIPGKDVLKAMRKDLDALKKLLAEAGIH